MNGGLFGQPMNQYPQGMPFQLAQNNFALAQGGQMPSEGRPSTMPNEGRPAQMPQSGQPAMMPQEGAPAEMPNEGRPAEMPREGREAISYIGNPLIDHYIHSFIG
jgi:hypothetical protein